MRTLKTGIAHLIHSEMSSISSAKGKETCEQQLTEQTEVCPLHG